MRLELRLIWIALCLSLLIVAPNRAVAGLTITLHDQGGTPSGDMIGGGNLDDIVRAAASVWERVFSDPGVTWDLSLDYGWSSLKIAPAGENGKHILVDQQGDPNRETAGIIKFDNTSFTSWYADPNPLDSQAYSSFQDHTTILGGTAIAINDGRYGSAAVPEAMDRIDLFSVALHEIGHALGLSQDNLSFQKQVPGNELRITIPGPYLGGTIMTFTDHVNGYAYQYALMVPIPTPGVRYRISQLDVLALEQLNGFPHPNDDPYAVPEPGTVVLLVMGVAGTWALGRRSRVLG